MWYWWLLYDYRNGFIERANESEIYLITEVTEITVGIETDAIIEIAKGNRNTYGNSSSKGNENRYDNRNNNGNRNRCDNINSKRKQQKYIWW